MLTSPPFGLWPGGPLAREGLPLGHEPFRGGAWPGGKREAGRDFQSAKVLQEMINLIFFTQKFYVIGLRIIHGGKHNKSCQEITDVGKRGLLGCNLDLLDSERLDDYISQFY